MCDNFIQIWADVPEYQINTMGDVYNVRLGRLLKQSVMSKGYAIVMIYVGGKKTYRLVHQLMAITYLGHKPSGHKIIVDHINGNKLDNRLENLQLITTRENSTKDIKRDLPTGVTERRGKYRAGIHYKGRFRQLGTYSTPEEASRAYQVKLKSI